MTVDEFKQAEKLKWELDSISKTFDEFLELTKNHEENPNYPLKIFMTNDRSIEIPINLKFTVLDILSKHFTEIEDRAKIKFREFTL